jgi:hypothetical protein
MKTTDLLTVSLTFSAREALALIDDMQDAPLTFPTANGGNHPLWVLGHQAVSESKVINGIMLGGSSPLALWAPLFGPGSIPVADPTVYPSFTEVRKVFDEVRAKTLSLLASLSDADLDQTSQACPKGYETYLGTYGLGFRHIASHFTYHAGQVADARRMAGRGAVPR